MGAVGWAATNKWNCAPLQTHWRWRICRLGWACPSRISVRVRAPAGDLVPSSLPPEGPTRLWVDDPGPFSNIYFTEEDQRWGFQGL